MIEIQLSWGFVVAVMLSSAATSLIIAAIGFAILALRDRERKRQNDNKEDSTKS